MKNHTYSVTVLNSWVLNYTLATGNEDYFLQRVNRIIEENLSSENFDLLQLCQAMHLERTQLYRRIKASTGEGPSVLIREARLTRAHHLLMSTDMNIAEIAYETGFKERSHFTKAYRGRFGQTPKESRNNRILEV